MGAKGVRYLPVVVDASHVVDAEVVSEEGTEGQGEGEEEEVVEVVDKVVVGVLSRESVRIAGRLTETEGAVRVVALAPPASLAA